MLRDIDNRSLEKLFADGAEIARLLFAQYYQVSNSMGEAVALLEQHGSGNWAQAARSRWMEWDRNAIRHLSSLGVELKLKEASDAVQG